MRLRLFGQTGTSEPSEKRWRLLERGELTLGRDPSCHWPLSDPERRISKVHCRIRRDATGFTVTDESTNGLTVDRRELAQGEVVRLQKGSVIAFCGHRFVVEIIGDVDPDWRDPDARYAPDEESLSISAILSDISPGGSSATGMVPGSSGDDAWIDALGDPERADALDLELPASRPRIGWQGAPSEAITGSGFESLPDDWDSESGTSSRAEHRVATSTRMRLPRTNEGETAPDEPVPSLTRPSADEAASVFFAQAGTRATVEDPLLALEEAGLAYRAMMEALAAIGIELSEIAEEAGAALSGRLAAFDASQIVTHQRALLPALRALLTEVDALAPAQIGLRARFADDGAKGIAAHLPVPGRAERAFVDQHRRTYEGTDASSPRARFAKALGAQPLDPAADDFEELGADRSRRGDLA